tara:strand:+ start:6522 stop:6686 length:165 start_codon:yes stop_codon:yes gene_type:complete
LQLYRAKKPERTLSKEQLRQIALLEFQKCYEFETNQEAAAYKKGIEASVDWQEI